MSETEPRTYGIHAVWPLPDGSGVGICCECRTLTHLHFDFGGITRPEEIALPEQAFTCEGCKTVHWFRLGTPEGAEGP